MRRLLLVGVVLAGVLQGIKLVETGGSRVLSWVYVLADALIAVGLTLHASRARRTGPGRPARDAAAQEPRVPGTGAQTSARPRRRTG